MKYWRLGGTNRKYLQLVKARRLKVVAEMRRVKVKATMTALDQMIKKGFAFTNNLTAFAEVIGYLKANQIPYEYIDGGKHWKYAIRQLNREEQKDA